MPDSPDRERAVEHLIALLRTLPTSAEVDIRSPLGHYHISLEAPCILPPEEITACPPPLTECEQDILDILRCSSLRLTGEEVKAALAKGGKIYGDSTVDHALASLRRTRRIVNGREDGRSRGYGLPM